MEQESDEPKVAVVTPFDHKSIPNPQNSLLIDYIPYEFIDPNMVLIFLKRVTTHIMVFLLCNNTPNIYSILTQRSRHYYSIGLFFSNILSL